MGFKIKEVRKSLKMSQEELAEKSGVSRGTIVALEAGTERVTTTKTLVALAAAMNVSIDQIFLPMMFNRLNARRTTWTPQFTSTWTKYRRRSQSESAACFSDSTSASSRTPNSWLSWKPTEPPKRRLKGSVQNDEDPDDRVWHHRRAGGSPAPGGTVRFDCCRCSRVCLAGQQWRIGRRRPLDWSDAPGGAG